MTMTTRKILVKFAKENNIPTENVYHFLEKIKEVKNLDDLLKLPNDMLTHYTYITEVENPLHDFINDGNTERYQTVTLFRVLESWGEQYEDAVEQEDEEALADLLKLKKQIIETKFGSVVFDW